MAQDPDSEGTRVALSAGDSLAAVAKANGFLWKTLWDHPENAQLRQLRGTPNQLVEGDALFLPPKGRKEVARGIDARHRFKRRGEPTRLKLQLLDMDRPRRGLGYTLAFGDQVIHGTTDDEGKLDEPIPGDTRTALLTLGEAEAYEVAIGELNPPDMVSGARHRLDNLGFDCGGESGEDVGPATREALLRFQRTHGLDQTGEADDATRARLAQLHV